MAELSGFSGFPRAAVSFLEDLAQNNDKAWFEKHRGVFEEKVLAPARSFVLEMGWRLKELSPEIIADPRVNRSLFRLNRDTRFSRDKTPYKTHLALWFWEGPGKRMECSGYYFHLEPPELMLGVGLYCFPEPMLKEYRRSVVHPRHGPALARAIRQVSRKGPSSLGGRHYKRTPRGFDPQDPNASLLLHNGLYAAVWSAIPPELYSSALVDYCFERFKDMSPLHHWLLALTRRVASAA